MKLRLPTEGWASRNGVRPCTKIMKSGREGILRKRTGRKKPGGRSAKLIASLTCSLEITILTSQSLVDDGWRHHVLRLFTNVR